MTRADASLGLPSIRLELLEDLSPDADKGFLRLVRRKVRALYPDGTASEPFIYDEVDRTRIDASVIAAHYVDGAGERRVFRRLAPVYFRGRARPARFRQGERSGAPAPLSKRRAEPEGLFLAGVDWRRGKFTVLWLKALGPSSFRALVIAER
jgi:hypothetical protein